MSGKGKCKNLVFHLVVDSYKIQDATKCKDILDMSLVWKPLRNVYFLAKNN